jgi:hypothetical protein
LTPWLDKVGRPAREAGNLGEIDRGGIAVFPAWVIWVSITIRSNIGD